MKNLKPSKKMFIAYNLLSDTFEIKMIENRVLSFHLKTKLKKNKKNFIYNWTEKFAGKKIVTSGLGILQYQYWLKIY